MRAIRSLCCHLQVCTLVSLSRPGSAGEGDTMPRNSALSLPQNHAIMTDVGYKGFRHALRIMGGGESESTPAHKSSLPAQSH